MYVVDVILGLHYVPGRPWAALFAGNVACCEILVIYFSVLKICFQDLLLILLSFLTLYYDIRNKPW